MGLGLGLRLGLGGAGVLGAAGPTYDPDAAEWFEAVEATGATFGPDSSTVDANKTAWSNWVIAQKNAESPIAGRSNWQQLTEPGEGYIQPMMGLSTFNVPALFGGSEFTSFVSGDHDPALGLRGGPDRVLTANRNWDSVPLNNVGTFAFITELPETDGRIWGPFAGGVRYDNLGSSGFVRSRNSTADTTSTFLSGTVPRLALVSRHLSTEYVVGNGATATTIDRVSVLAPNVPVTFFAGEGASNTTDTRLGVVGFGRAINHEAMNTACVALSEAITWP